MPRIFYYVLILLFKFNANSIRPQLKPKDAKKKPEYMHIAEFNYNR